MRHYKKVVVPARPEEVKNRLHKTTCDICGVTIKDKMHNVDKVSVQYKTGADYPDGGSGSAV